MIPEELIVLGFLLVLFWGTAISLAIMALAIDLSKYYRAKRRAL